MSHKLGSSLCLGVNPPETASEVLVSYFVRTRLLAWSDVFVSSQWEDLKCNANLATELASFCLLMVRYSRMAASSPSLPVLVCSEYVCCKFVWVLVHSAIVAVEWLALCFLFVSILCRFSARIPAAFLLLSLLEQEPIASFSILPVSPFTSIF